jgi:hypothetical protein
MVLIGLGSTTSPWSPSSAHAMQRTTWFHPWSLSYYIHGHGSSLKHWQRLVSGRQEDNFRHSDYFLTANDASAGGGFGGGADTGFSRNVCRGHSRLFLLIVLEHLRYNNYENTLNFLYYLISFSNCGGGHLACPADAHGHSTDWDWNILWRVTF